MAERSLTQLSSVLSDVVLSSATKIPGRRRRRVGQNELDNPPPHRVAVWQCSMSSRRLWKNTEVPERGMAEGRPADLPVRCGTSMFSRSDPVVTPISDATAIINTDARMSPRGERERVSVSQ